MDGARTPLPAQDAHQPITVIRVSAVPEHLFRGPLMRRPAPEHPAVRPLSYWLGCAGGEQQRASAIEASRNHPASEAGAGYRGP